MFQYSTSVLPIVQSLSKLKSFYSVKCIHLIIYFLKINLFSVFVFVFFTVAVVYVCLVGLHVRPFSAIILINAAGYTPSSIIFTIW